MKPLCLFCALILASFHAAFAQLADTPWPMFQRDRRHTGQSASLGPSSPVLAWSYKTEGPMYIGSPTLGGGSEVYFGCDDNNVYARGNADALLWSYRTGNDVQCSPTIGGDGRIYVGSEDDHLYALNSNGSLAWSLYGLGDTTSSPVMGNDGTLYLGGGYGTFYAVNSNGTFKWTYATGITYSSPSMGADGRLYVGSRGHERLYALNSAGTLSWSYQADDDMDSSPALGTDGTVYAGSGVNDHNFYAFTSSGALSWSYYMPTAAHTSSPPLSSQGHLFVGSNPGPLFSFTSGGSFRWSYWTGGGTVPPAPVLGSDGTVYVGANDGRIYSLGAAGAFLWSYRTGGSIWSGSALGNDGRLYAGSNDTRMYCLGVSGAATPSPTATAVPGEPTSTPLPTSTPPPAAIIAINGSSFGPGDQFAATFRLNESITRPFTAFSVIILPDGSMLDTFTLSPAIQPVASNAPALTAPFEYPLLDLPIPQGAPAGSYELVAAFFDPTRPITKREDAFLEASSKFTIE